NKFKSNQVEVPTVLKIDPMLEAQQIERLHALRVRRDAARVNQVLARLQVAAQSEDNVVPPLLESVEAYATIGEISDTFRKIWGEYHDNR
ncbi:MAG: methylmalonyl-CoA mutase family protein, partial [candidate division Zixibacteria bacterium]|nr:methylmalonyl-CoA mutase family protein [candidate division Zixibacteria bacterium]